MKKFLTLAMAAFIFLAAFAQTKPAEKATKTATKEVTKTKKDGTPDMRYKENKEKEKPKGPTKKDGTPDMRYKENKKKG